MGWISVEERKPANNLFVLVCASHGLDEYFVQVLNVAFWADHGRGWLLDTESRYIILDGITHWQPLPEKP